MSCPGATVLQMLPKIHLLIHQALFPSVDLSLCTQTLLFFSQLRQLRKSNLYHIPPKDWAQMRRKFHSLRNVHQEPIYARLVVINPRTGTALFLAVQGRHVEQYTSGGRCL